jgi:hypothetical protein
MYSERQKKNLGNFEKRIEMISSEQFQSMIGQETTSHKIEDYSNITVFGHWLCIILVSHRDMIIRFKTHFSTDSGRAMVNALGLDEQGTQDQKLIVDIVKEFNNLVAGQVKESLDTVSGSESGITLPFITRGFDQHLAMCHVRRSKAVRFYNFWTLETKNCDLIMSTEIQMNEWDILEDIKGFRNEEREKGNLEFL